MTSFDKSEAELENAVVAADAYLYVGTTDPSALKDRDAFTCSRKS